MQCCRTRSPNLCSLLLVLLVGAANGDELRVLGGKGDTLLHEYLMSEMRAQCEVRRGAVEASLQSAEAVARRAGQLRERYRRILVIRII